jgi:ABC-type oligopeptide transport system ATPase subunit
MENPEKQLAVEWLIDELYKQGIHLYASELIEQANTPELIEQAKAMEEDGRHASYLYGHKVGFTKAKEIEEEQKKNNQSKSSEPYLH